MRYDAPIMPLIFILLVLIPINIAIAQSNNAFHDAYGTMTGPGTAPKNQDKNYYISQQSNMGGRGDVNAGVNPRGNVDVNPPGFSGDNPFGNSTVPNP